MKSLLVNLFVILLLIVIACEKKVEHTSDIKDRTRVFDHALLLTTEQEDSLIQLIVTIENEIGSQLAIITIDSIPEKNIETFSFKAFEKLGLGRVNFDDGLITVAVKNRQMRIEVGYGLEKIIRDEIASRINREEMAPNFKEHDYYGGLMKGVHKIKKLIEENKNLVGQRP